MASRAAIFDLDGVLVDSMPLHVRAWRTAFESEAGVRTTERELYLLEGMRGAELVQKIFERNGLRDPDSILAKKVSEQKNRLFRAVKHDIKPFEGVREVIESLQCRKAVVSGSAKDDVVPIIERAFGKGAFELIITADDVQRGKPDPSSFLDAARRLQASASDSTVIENAPLGVQAARNGGLGCIVVLNNSPLVASDFEGLVWPDKILDSTASIKGVLSCSRA